jgi:hypothetical protein
MWTVQPNGAFPMHWFWERGTGDCTKRKHPYSLLRGLFGSQDLVLWTLMMGGNMEQHHSVPKWVVLCTTHMLQRLQDHLLSLAGDTGTSAHISTHVEEFLW